jgi:capsule polysaccharide export protein KpsE/RkpR
MSERDRLVATLRERASDQLTFAETHVAQITAALARARSSLHKRP